MSTLRDPDKQTILSIGEETRGVTDDATLVNWAAAIRITLCMERSMRALSKARIPGSIDAHFRRAPRCWMTGPGRDLSTRRTRPAARSAAPGARAERMWSGCRRSMHLADLRAEAS